MGEFRTVVYPCDIDEAAHTNTGEALSIAADMHLISTIQNAPDVESAIQNLQRITIAKTALKTADEFRKQSVKYAMLEAAALVRVIELGGAKSIKPYRRRKAAEWLAELTQEERNEMVQRCTDGITLEHVYQLEIDNPRKEAQAIVTAKNYEAAVVDTFDTMGVVTLGKFDERLDALPIDQQVAQGVKDRVRDKIRRRGGVGIGDGNGTYVNASNAEKIGEAIEVRIASLQADFFKLVELAKLCKQKPIIRINTYDNMNQELPIGDLFAVMLAACRVVKVETTTPYKEGIIMASIINATFPSFWRSTSLFDRVFHESVANDNRLSDKAGKVSDKMEEYAGCIKNFHSTAEAIGQLLGA